MATADNASAVFYNAAGLTQTDGTLAQANVFSISLAHTFDGTLGGTPGTAKNDDGFQSVPSFFISHRMQDRPLAFGFGVYAPFALGTDWGLDSPIGQYILPYKAELRYIKYHFVTAWQINKELSIAAGLSYDDSDIDIRSGPSGLLGSYEGGDQTLGYSVSLLWQPSAQHSFGLNYQGRTEVDYEGTWTAVPGTSTSAAITLPESIVAGYAWKPSDKWNLEINLDWTNWDVVDDLSLDNPLAGVTNVPLNWQSAFIWEFGITRYLENGLHLSTGYTFVENAVPDADLLPIVPDSDRHFFSVGVGGKHNSFTWQLAYQIAIDNGRSVSGNNYGLNGEYDLDSQAFAASVGYNW